jgi:hypothetical protein
MSECGKGWSRRCAAAKGKKCRCRCGGENHGAARREGEDGSRRTSDEELYYGFDDRGNPEKRAPRRLLAGSEKIERVIFSRSPVGRAIVELIYSDRAGTWPLAHRYQRHSPDGFEFGYGGSGPAECALNLLAMFIPVKEATTRETSYQDFKFKFIGAIPQETGGALDADEIRNWIRDRWAVAELTKPAETVGS